MMLSGWGRYPSVECRTRVLRDLGDIGQVVEEAPSLIARGNGRSYGDASLNPDLTLLMNACDRIRGFDMDNGLIDCEAGILLSDIIKIAVPRGWFPWVVPGTKFVTLGGLIAADVHGKNHHLGGSFGRYVESLRLALADGTVVQCSQSENSEIFAATLGGMGLTGVILSAKIRLRPIKSNLINETVVRAPSLQVLLDLFTENKKSTYSVAWIDCLAGGGQFGRGVLLLGEHGDAQSTGDQQRANQLRVEKPRTISVPFELPISPLNKWSIQLFNSLYYRLQNPRTRRVNYDGFFFPLDAIDKWNRIYGKSGFVQYQCVIGGNDSERGLRRILEVVREAGVGSFLAVLKKLGPGHRFMSFPTEGYTITLDIPVHRRALSCLAKLDVVVADFKGRIYLAKDARAPRGLIEQGYPEIDAFRKLRRTIDPKQQFRSALSERLGL